MELQDADAPDVAGAQPRLFGRKRARRLTRLLWLPEDKAPVRLWPPESRNGFTSDVYSAITNSPIQTGHSLKVKDGTLK